MKTVIASDMFRRTPVVVIPKLDIKPEDKIIIKDNKIIKINKPTNSITTEKNEYVEKLRSTPLNGLRKHTRQHVRNTKEDEVLEKHLPLPTSPPSFNETSRNNRPTEIKSVTRRVRKIKTKAPAKPDDQLIEKNNKNGLKVPAVVLNKIPDEVLKKYSTCPLSSTIIDEIKKNELNGWPKIILTRIEDTISFCSELGLKPSFRINNNIENSFDNNNNNEHCQILKKPRIRLRKEISYKD